MYLGQSIHQNGVSIDCAPVKFRLLDIDISMASGDSVDEIKMELFLGHQVKSSFTSCNIFPMPKAKEL